MPTFDDILIEFAKKLTPAEWRAVERHTNGRASKLSWRVIRRFRVELQQLATKKGDDLEQVRTKKGRQLQQVAAKKRGGIRNRLKPKKAASSRKFALKRESWNKLEQKRGKFGEVRRKKGHTS